MSLKIKSELDKITNQIIEKYQPLKVILYGSVAKEKANENSDLDFFIIKETKDDRIKRTQKLASLIERNIPCDFLVYTPEEFEKRQSLGDFFIQDIISTGKIVYEKQ